MEVHGKLLLGIMLRWAHEDKHWVRANLSKDPVPRGGNRGQALGLSKDSGLDLHIEGGRNHEICKKLKIASLRGPEN